MKRIIPVLLLICIISLAVAGCAKKGDGADEADSSSFIDLDMTKMSSVLVYSQVISIYDSPKDYLGKRIKMQGQYYPSYFDETDLFYHFVVVGDETLCCQAVLEFAWEGEHKFPDDYPAENAAIEVTGVLGTYEELGQTYYLLSVDDMSVLE